MLGRFYTTVLPIVVALPTGVLLFEFFVFTKRLEGPSLYLNNSSLILLYVLWLVSYYQSIFLRNDHSNYSVAPRRKIDRSQYNSIAYLNNNTCDREGGRFKPVRCSHCHVCGCVLRMVPRRLCRTTTVPGPTTVWVCATIGHSWCSARLPRRSVGTS